MSILGSYCLIGKELQSVEIFWCCYASSLMPERTSERQSRGHFACLELILYGIRELILILDIEWSSLRRTRLNIITILTSLTRSKKDLSVSVIAGNPVYRHITMFLLVQLSNHRHHHQVWRIFGEPTRVEKKIMQKKNS